jgi:hypothetical protein
MTRPYTKLNGFWPILFLNIESVYSTWYPLLSSWYHQISTEILLSLVCTYDTHTIYYGLMVACDLSLANMGL